MNEIGNVVRHADMISYQQEQVMWESGVLGEENPNQLCATVLFLIGLNIDHRS